MKTFLCALGAVGLLMGAARADLKWTETTSVGAAEGTESAGFAIKSTHYMNAEAGRTDTEAKIGPMAMTSREISLCPKKLSLSLLDSAKLYSEAPLADGGGMMSMPKMPAMGGMIGGMDAAPKAKGVKKTGTQTISFSLRDLGTEKILDIPTRHMALDSTVTSTGCAGTGTTKTKMEVWTANFPMPAPCLATTFDGTVKSVANIESDCDVKTTYKGNPTAAVSKLFGGFIMRMKVGMGQSSFTREVTMISRAKLAPDTFQVPADYRKVTPEEFDKARQSAMMKSLMGGGKAGGGDGDTPQIENPPLPVPMPDNN